MRKKPTYDELEERVKALEIAIDQQKKALLNVLADEWDEVGPPGIVDIKDVAERLNISVEDAVSIIKPLFVDGIIDADDARTAVYLTPEGYDLARYDLSDVLTARGEKSIESILKQLKNLFEKELITREEYDKKKAELLEKL
jgi:predicted transcriptional regulator